MRRLDLLIHEFEAYKIYLAITRHFNSDQYDFFKYHGKVRCSEESFDRRHDRYYFERLAKKPDVVGYLVANIVERNPKWIGDFFGDAGEQSYLDQQKRIQSLSYLFTEELKKVNFSEEDIKVKEGQHPKLLVDFLQKTLSIETLIILDDIIGFSSVWNKKIIDTIVWPNILKKMRSYQPFFSYDKQKVRKLLIDFIKNK